MYETIIVPVDVNNAEKASDMLIAAERIGGKKAKVVLLNVIEAVPNYVAVHLPEEFREQVWKEATDGLSRIAKSTSLETEIEVRGGHASAEILTVADERNADAIIIASHRPGLEDYFLGSTASRVVRHAKCTVVVIR
ncbi:MAG: universal stress protein [Hyphomicrobiaceae bacterium]